MRRKAHNRWKRFWPGVFLALAILAAFILSGCVQVYMDAGPNPAKVTVNLDANASMEKHKGARWYLPSKDIYWDWGLYLVTGEDSLAPLGPASKERLKSIMINPLQRQTTFLVPPGKRTVRIIVEAYIFRPSSEGEISVGIGTWIKDFTMDLTGGGTKTLNLKFGHK